MGVSPHRRLNLGEPVGTGAAEEEESILRGLGVRHAPITFARGSFSSKFVLGAPGFFLPLQTLTLPAYLLCFLSRRPPRLMPSTTPQLLSCPPGPSRSSIPSLLTAPVHYHSSSGPAQEA